MIRVQTYSPWLEQFETDADSSSQFTLPYDMSRRRPYQLIGTASGVPRGRTPPSTGPGSRWTREYEWYATVNDGVSTTTSTPVWSFTTAPGGACGDGAIGAGESCDDGSTQDGDGCSASCQIEACFGCAGAPSVCAPTPGTPCAADGNICTDDVCSAAGTCGVPNTAPCGDGLFCTGADVCSGGYARTTGRPCLGGSECNDACNELADSCADPAGTVCAPDANVCTTDVCNGAGLCGTTTASPVTTATPALR